jgi:hypothetical protein
MKPPRKDRNRNGGFRRHPLVGVGPGANRTISVFQPAGRAARPETDDAAVQQILTSAAGSGLRVGDHRRRFPVATFPHSRASIRERLAAQPDDILEQSGPGDRPSSCITERNSALMSQLPELLDVLLVMMIPFNVVDYSVVVFAAAVVIRWLEVCFQMLRSRRLSARTRLPGCLRFRPGLLRTSSAGLRALPAWK